MKSAILPILAAGLALPAAQATVIANTSFENEVDLGFYEDSDGSTHDLVNSGGTVTDDGTVDSTVTSTLAGDLSFDASYVDSLSSTGLTDGDFVGVTSFTGTVGAYTNGVQGYQMSDTDGTMVLTFGTVNLAGFVGNSLHLDFFVADTGYESADVFDISLTTDSGTISLLNLVDTDLEGRGSWEHLAYSIPNSETFATLEVSLTTNAGTEAIFLDRVAFRGQVIPEPTATLLGGLGLLALLRRRR